MGPLGNAACPRCGAKPQSAAAKFCPRCGLELPRMQQNPSVPNAPSWRAQPPAVPSYPPLQTPPQMYGQPPMQAGGYMPQPRIVPPPKKTSGCGCLLALLLLIVVIAAIGSLSQRSSRRVPASTPSLQTLIEQASNLPNRPAKNFVPPRVEPDNLSAPTLRNCTVRRVNIGGVDHLQLMAEVGPGFLDRVLVAAYFLDNRDNPISGTTFDNSTSQGYLAAGAWVSRFDDHMPSHGEDDNHGYVHTPPIVTQTVTLDIPVQSARTQPAFVEFSLFDDQQTEFARIRLSVPQKF